MLLAEGLPGHGLPCDKDCDGDIAESRDGKGAAGPRGGSLRTTMDEVDTERLWFARKYAAGRKRCVPGWAGESQTRGGAWRSVFVLGPGKRLPGSWRVVRRREESARRRGRRRDGIRPVVVERPLKRILPGLIQSLSTREPAGVRSTSCVATSIPASLYLVMHTLPFFSSKEQGSHRDRNGAIVQVLAELCGLKWTLLTSSFGPYIYRLSFRQAVDANSTRP
jgi:hypothetical protein